MKPQITVVRIGPGGVADMTSHAIDVLRHSRIIVGYNYYIPFITQFIQEDTEIIHNSMRQELSRIEKAFEIAESSKEVTIIS